MSGSTLTELITKFTFQGNSNPLSDYTAKLSASLKGLTAFTAGISAAVGATMAWISPTLDAVDALGNLSQELKIPIDRIQELGFIAQMSNSSAEELNASLQGLSRTAALAANDLGLGRAIFKELNINVKDSNGNLKNTGALLDEIRKRMNELDMSTDERRAFAQKLGLSPNLVQLLSRTDAEMAALSMRARELGTLTAEQAEAAAQYNDSLDTLKWGLSSLRQLIAVGVAPAFTNLVNTFVDLLVENRGWIVDGIRVTLDLLTDLLAMIGRVLPVLAGMGAVFVAMKIYTLGWAAAMGILFSPVVVISAAVAALLFVVDDLLVAFKGGESLIGSFFKNFLGIDLSKLIGQLAVIGQWMVDIGKALAGKVGRFFGFGGGAPALAVQGVAMPKAPIDTGGGLRNDNRQVNQQVNIEIKTDDPVRAGNAAADSIRKQVRDGNAQLGVGGF